MGGRGSSSSSASGRSISTTSLKIDPNADRQSSISSITDTLSNASANSIVNTSDGVYTKQSGSQGWVLNTNNRVYQSVSVATTIVDDQAPNGWVSTSSGVFKK